MSVVRQAVSQAREVWVLGWSMPETDKNVREMLRQAVQERTTPLQMVRIVDIQAGKKSGVADRVRATLPAQEMEEHWDGLTAWTDLVPRP